MNPEIFGYIAAFLTTTAFLPQVIKCWRSRHTRDLALPFAVMTTTGLFMWLLYGILLGSLPLILSNGVSLALTSSLLVLKLRYG